MRPGNLAGLGVGRIPRNVAHCRRDRPATRPFPVRPVRFLQRPANFFTQSHCRSDFLLRCHEVTTDVGHFTNEPEHWRARAKEAHNLANKMNDAKSKDAMLRIAEDYEHLAQRAKDRARGRLSNSRTKTLEAKGGHT